MLELSAYPPAVRCPALRYRLVVPGEIRQMQPDTSDESRGHVSTGHRQAIVTRWGILQQHRTTRISFSTRKNQRKVEEWAELTQ